MRFAARLPAFPARYQQLAKLLLGISLLVALVAVGSHLMVFGLDKRSLALGALIVLLPVILYAALRVPIIFPLGIFVLLVPFDDLLRLDHTVGTLTKLVAVCAGAALVFWLVRNRRSVKPSKVVFVWLGLLVWMAMSIFWAVDPTQSLTKLTTYAELIALYIIISIMPITARDHKAFLYTITLSGVIAAAYSIYLYHTGSFVQHVQIEGVSSSRLLVRFGDDKWAPDELSAGLLLPVALVMTWALQSAWSLKKIGLIGLFVILVGGMYVNGSRGALVALAVFIGYLIWRGRFKAQLIALSLLALGASFLLPTSPWARFTSAASTGGSGRIPIWSVGLSAIKQHWLVGAGVGNFPWAYDQNFIRVYQLHSADWHRAPHNILLEYWVELGIIGLVLLVAAWYMQMRCLQAIPRTSPLFDLRIALEGAVLALFVASLFVGTMDGKYTWILFEIVAVTRSFALFTSPSLPAQSPVYADSRWKFSHTEPPALKEPVNA